MKNGYRFVTGWTFEISDKACKKMKRYRQKTKRKVAAGLLLGMVNSDQKHVKIEDVTLPKRKDERSEEQGSLFLPLHQEEIDEAWKDSEGLCNYLGMWHSRFEEGISLPSSVDLEVAESSLNPCVIHGDVYYGVIISTDTISVWSMTNGELFPRLAIEV